jgi:uncharacterized membrane protein
LPKLSRSIKISKNIGIPTSQRFKQNSQATIPTIESRNLIKHSFDQTLKGGWLMRGVSRFRLLGATVLALVLVNSLGVNLDGRKTGQQWLEGDQAAAQSGGRARGGSFDRRPSGGTGGSGGGGGGFQPAPAPYGGYPYDTRPYSRPLNPGPVIIPVPAGGGYGGYGGGGGYVSTGGGGFGFLVFMCLFLIFPIASMYLSRAGRRGSYQRGGQGGFGGYSSTSELTNDIVTVTRVQVAMLAQARFVQERLTNLTLHADTETPEGLAEMLRETVVALMRMPENWTHASSSSQTVKSREQAAQLFEQLSITERSKFTAETLVKVGGRVRRQTLEQTEKDPAAYIVVTLLVGTADDRPIIPDKIHSSTELQSALKRIGAITPAYLLIYELLWSPQDPSDSLTYDELLTNYPDLTQI